uniref:Uncharacterized protein n=1 Tax=viral metagenome TaxID=1070528 RepID=A0A6C0HRB0_9ZZZZ
MFVILNFIVSFISDIVLNDLSTHFNIIKSLQPYFYKQSILISAFLAGMTVVIALVINIFFSYFLFGFTIPNNFTELLYFSSLAFVVGFIIDGLIYKLKIFDNRLNSYYKTVGVGFWGAMAFVFSIIISYFIQKQIYSVCYGRNCIST